MNVRKNTFIPVSLFIQFKNHRRRTNGNGRIKSGHSDRFMGNNCGCRLRNFARRLSDRGKKLVYTHKHTRTVKGGIIVVVNAHTVINVYFRTEYLKTI